MATYADMRARIADELGNDAAITDTQINNAIQSAIKQYERRPWWFNTRIVTFNTIANGELYRSNPTSVFANMVAIQSLQLITSFRRPLRAVDNNLIDHYQNGTVKGRPQLYARADNALRMYPIPDQTYQIEMLYVYKLDTLVNDSDSNYWTDEAEDLIRQSAKRRVALDIIQADEIAARCAVLEKEAFAEMLAEDRRRRPNTIQQTPELTGMSVPSRFNINIGY